MDVKRLAEKGAHVVLAGRDEAKCRAAIERIRGELASEGGGGAGGPSSSADTEFQHLDLASFK